MPKLFGPYIRQYATIIAVNISILCTGLGAAWTSPVLIILKGDTQSVLSRPLTDEEGAWVTAMSFISGLTFLVFFAIIIDKLGRKYAILVLAMPRVLCYIAMLFVSEYWMVLVARFLAGMSDALSPPAVSIYASEVASKQIRAGLGALVPIFNSLGILLMWCIGPFLDFYTLNIFVLVLSVVAALLPLCVPDSPYFLYRKGRTEDAVKVMTKLRCSEIAAREEIQEYNTKCEEKSFTFKEIIHSMRLLKSLGLVIAIGALTQLTGTFIVTTNLQSLLETTQTNFSSKISSVIVGVLQFIPSCFSGLLADRFGRKPLLLICLFGMFIGYNGMGIYFKVTSSGDNVYGFWNYVPLISLICIVISYNAGIGSIHLPLMSELLDGRIRALGMTLAQTFGLTIVIATLTTFPLLLNTVGGAAVYWGFSAVCLLKWLFIFVCVPETKGKSLNEIQNALIGSKSKEMTSF